jgi:hypothetical protein
MKPESESQERLMTKVRAIRVIFSTQKFTNPTQALRVTFWISSGTQALRREILSCVWCLQGKWPASSDFLVQPSLRDIRPITADNVEVVIENRVIQDDQRQLEIPTHLHANHELVGHGVIGRIRG